MRTLADRRVAQLVCEREALKQRAFAYEATGRSRAALRQLQAAAAVDARIVYLKSKLAAMAVVQVSCKARLLPPGK